MGCYLILTGVALAFLDLYLLAGIFETYGFLAGLAALFLPSMLLGPVALRQRQQLAQDMQATPGAAPVHLPESVLLLVASGLFVFPGPLSTVLGLLLLIPFVRRFVIRHFFRQLAKQVAQPMASGDPNAPSGPVFIRVVSVNGVTQVSGAGPQPSGGGGLKTVEGRTLDDSEAQNQLPEGKKPSEEQP
ncbi:MAG: FxsA family protein [Planctomycetes bacterium]|nr:FxsA family protein [Planctomycetota bacterium]